MSELLGYLVLFLLLAGCTAAPQRADPPTDAEVRATKAAAHRGLVWVIRCRR